MILISYIAACKINKNFGNKHRSPPLYFIISQNSHEQCGWNVAVARSQNVKIIFPEPSLRIDFLQGEGTSLKKNAFLSEVGKQLSIRRLYKYLFQKPFPSDSKNCHPYRDGTVIPIGQAPSSLRDGTAIPTR
jgi:hypothetical protein